MTKSSSRLRLGPLPKTDSIKLTIVVSIELKTTLDRYADLHAQAWSEPVDATTLIPHMLAAFMERDRAFKALRNGPKPARTASASLASTTSSSPVAEPKPT